MATWCARTARGGLASTPEKLERKGGFNRFNRRFYPMTAFNSVLGLAAHTVSPTYEQLYKGKSGHPDA